MSLFEKSVCFVTSSVREVIEIVRVLASRKITKKLSFVKFESADIADHAEIILIHLL